MIDVETYKEHLSRCSESELFYFIDNNGAAQFYLQHEWADGRLDMSKEEYLEKMEFVTKKLELACEQTKRFGVQVPLLNGEDYYQKEILTCDSQLVLKMCKEEDYKKEKMYPTDEYKKWYKKAKYNLS